MLSLGHSENNLFAVCTHGKNITHGKASEHSIHGPVKLIYAVRLVIFCDACCFASCRSESTNEYGVGSVLLL